MTKRLGIILIGILVVISALMMSISCTSAPASTPPPAVTVAPPTVTVTADATKPIELKVDIPWAATSKQNDHFLRLKSKLEADSGGKLTLRIFPSSALVPAMEAYDGLTKGLTDIGAGSRYEQRGVDFTMNMLIFTVGCPTPQFASQISYDLYKQFPEYRKEWDSAKILYWIGTGPFRIITASKSVASMEDLKGLQIRSGPSGGMPELLKALGASPVSMPAGEVYTSMQKKTVEGCAFPFEALKSWRIGEVAKFVTNIELWSTPHNFVAMNLNSYNKLPPDLQKVIDGAMDWGRKDMNQVYFDQEQEGLGFAASLGVKLVDFTAEEKAKWYAAIAPLQDKTAADLDAKGLPGTQFKEFVRERIAYYTKNGLPK
ncbi:MAG: family 7 extracellular solute-binding protein [Chloroflexi bacterium]|nr:family 7 extracellular solute-binding protein [Chloroflexota bacterium]